MQTCAGSAMVVFFGECGAQQCECRPSVNNYLTTRNRAKHCEHMWTGLSPGTRYQTQTRSTPEPARVARMKKRGGYPPTRGGNEVSNLDSVSVLGGQYLFSQFHCFHLILVSKKVLFWWRSKDFLASAARPPLERFARTTLQQCI